MLFKEIPHELGGIDAHGCCERIRVAKARGLGQRIDSNSRIGNHDCDGQNPKMIILPLLRARSLDEPGTGIGSSIASNPRSRRPAHPLSAARRTRKPASEMI